MPMIIYTDNIIGENGLPINTTPAATYLMTDIGSILDRIKDGTIQCGTGKPYPINWVTDNQPEPPWYPMD